MSKTLNDLYNDGIEVTVGKDGYNDCYFVDVKYIKENGKYQDGEYLAGYTELTTPDDAEFLAKAFIDGYKLAKEVLHG